MSSNFDLASAIEQLPVAPLDASIPPPVPFGEDYERTATHEKGCSAFVAKTYAMVSDESLRELIRWEPAGTSFVVLQPDKLAPTLATHFKHRKFSSFVRQLNMYNYKKVGNPKQWEFYHDAFRRGRTHLLRYIKRKKSLPSSKSKVTAGLKTEVMGLKTQRDTLQHDIDLLTEQQCEMEVQLAQILEENSDLRIELENSRKAHENMRRCVDQLMAVVSSTFPDRDLSELTNVMTTLMCAAPPTAAAFPPPPMAAMGCPPDLMMGDGSEPARKRIKRDCGELDDSMCLVPTALRGGHPVKVEPLLAGRTPVLLGDSHRFPFGPVGDDMHIFGLPDDDDDFEDDDESSCGSSQGPSILAPIPRGGLRHKTPMVASMPFMGTDVL